MIMPSAEYLLAQVDATEAARIQTCLRDFHRILATRRQFHLGSPTVLNHAQLIFRALAYALGVLPEVTFSNRVFVNLIGNKGQAIAAARMLTSWKRLVTIESSPQAYENAQALLSESRRFAYHQHSSKLPQKKNGNGSAAREAEGAVAATASIMVNLGHPLTCDLFDADVVFIDLTTAFDEGCLISLLLPKLEEMPCGSFVIIITTLCNAPYETAPSFELIDTTKIVMDKGDEPASVKLLVYKTIRQSTDTRHVGR